VPEVRPGQVHYATATKAVNHGAPCIENGVPGIAIKQVAAPAGTGLGAAAITQVAIGEKVIIQEKGRVYVPNTRQEGGTFAKGDPVYIRTADNLLTAVNTNVKFGRCVEIAGERGVGAGQMRVDLDMKDQL
jgi:hypothetical protein